MNDPIVARERCHFVCPTGRRCKRKSLRGPYCFQHLAKEKQLRIKTSGIPNAGLGLFTTVARERGDLIAPYGDGQIVVSHDPSYGGSYVLQIKKNPPSYINAQRTNAGEGRYSNSNRGGRNNAQLLYNSRTRLGAERKAEVRATRSIPAGAEVTVPYGPQYWREFDRRMAAGRQ
jgi:hypothetical protein